MVCFSDHENELLKRITIDPQIAEGRPTVRDTRLAVDRILRLLLAGTAPALIMKRHAMLTNEDLAACLLCARVIHIPGSGA